MSTLKQWALFGGLTLCSLSAGAASTDRASGVIHFRGQIVEAPCVASSQSAVIDLSCYRNGKQASYQYKNGAVGAALPEFIQDVKTRWVNAERTLSELTITYR